MNHGFIWTKKGCTSNITTFCPRSPFSLCEFRKNYPLSRPVSRLSLSVFGDVRFRLYLNGQFLCDGPVAAGGDWANCDPMPKQYDNILSLSAGDGILSGKETELSFYATVFMPPVVMTDYSIGTPCFRLSAEAEYEDGTKEEFLTDESWDCRENPAYLSPYEYDRTVLLPDWKKAEVVSGAWNLVPSPLPPLAYEWIKPTGESLPLYVQPGETKEFDFDFPMVYAAYLSFTLHTEGLCHLTASISENGTSFHGKETVTADSDLYYRGLHLQSVGMIRIRIENAGDKTLSLSDVGLWSCSYPVLPEKQCGDFVCSDEKLNDLYRLCRHTLRICRQTLHLDSPLHQETLGCTGDYAIESLMTAMTFGDMRLSRLDILRTADLLRIHDGKMFHTSYSLIWVTMILDYVLFTGDKSIIRECADAIRILLHRFSGYGPLLCDAPNYMFIDWVNIDGFALHHPPRALGQTALCAFWYGALTAADRLFTMAGLDARAFRAEADRLYQAFEHFYDPEAGLYRDGDIGETPKVDWLPANAERTYHTRQSNTLAVMYGLCDKERGKAIMCRVAENRMPDAMAIQPYFLHYVLNALWNVGLFETYAMKIFAMWDEALTRSRKGLAEAFGGFGDISHAWGGTPAYQLPCRLAGLEILEPGLKKIRLAPSLCGLSHASIRIPSPLGLLCIEMKEGEAPVITAPDGMEILTD